MPGKAPSAGFSTPNNIGRSSAAITSSTSTGSGAGTSRRLHDAVPAGSECSPSLADHSTGRYAARGQRHVRMLRRAVLSGFLDQFGDRGSRQSDQAEEGGQGGDDGACDVQVLAPRIVCTLSLI